MPSLGLPGGCPPLTNGVTSNLYTRAPDGRSMSLQEKVLEKIQSDLSREWRPKDLLAEMPFVKPPQMSYADRGGKYQASAGVTAAKVDR